MWPYISYKEEFFLSKIQTQIILPNILLLFFRNRFIEISGRIITSWIFNLNHVM